MTLILPVQCILSTLVYMNCIAKFSQRAELMSITWVCL